MNLSRGWTFFLAKKSGGAVTAEAAEAAEATEAAATAATAALEPARFLVERVEFVAVIIAASAEFMMVSQ